MTEKTGKARKIFLIVSVIVFVVSLTLIIKTFVAEYNNKKMYNDLQNLISTSENTDEKISPDYSKIYEKNSDFVGWITIPQTSINYPVLQCDDNDYYLNHNFNKEKDSFGAIFMDYRNNPITLDSNTIIYGHNCYNETMFSELTKYQKLDFYKTSPVIEFNTYNTSYKWKIYGVFVTTANPDEDNGYVFNYIYPHMDGENFEGFIDEVNKRRLYVTDVDINDDDKMLVLSTCVRSLDTYEKGVKKVKADARLVVVARAVRGDESETVDVEKAYSNTNVKYPQIYYDNKKIDNPYKNDEKWYPKEVVQ